MEHLSMSCSMARLNWCILYSGFNFKKRHTSFQDLFGVWLRGFGAGKIDMIIVGSAAVLWTIWNSRNELCFERKKRQDPFVLVRRVKQWTLGDSAEKNRKTKRR